jgi:precorrin-2 methylase
MIVTDHTRMNDACADPADRLRALLELGHRVGVAVVGDPLDPFDQ